VGCAEVFERPCVLLPELLSSWCLCLQIVNCVGLLNYKFFLLFLFYTFLGSAFAIACLVKPMLTFLGHT